MKKLFLFVFAFAIMGAVQAQIKTPAPSPSQKIEQKVGLTDVTLEYSRPSMKDRTIFGGLVPYDKMWRTGANENSKITFSDDVEIGGKNLKAGTYAIFTKPGKETWEVYFYNDASNWGTPEKWDETKVAAMVKVPAIELPMSIESFTMMFSNLTNNSAELGIMWAKVYVPVSLKINTDKAVMASIEKVMNGPSAGDYYSAAVYYLESGNDINKAKTWIDKAVSMRSDAFWYYRQQSLIYAKAGDTKGAIKAAQTSLELAKKAGNDDYIALNTQSLNLWQGKTEAKK